MATWPSGNKASTTNLDAGTDKPSLARADIKQNVDNVNDIIDMFNISAPTNNQILKYNSTNTRFELSSDVDTNTTYSISAETATGGANLRLTGSDTTTDDVKLAAGTGISVSQTDSNTITITNTVTDTNTTYGISAETATGGVNLRLTGSDTTTDDVKLAEGSNITLTRTDANTITIAATDTTGVTVTNDTTTNATRYIVFEDVTSGSSTGVGVSSTKLTFNPSTGAVTATSFVGALTGNADTATTATNATNINISTTNGNSSDTTLSVVLVANQATGNQLPHIDGGLTYNASTNALTATTFVGSLTGNADTATSATSATSATTATTATGATNINISTTDGNTSDTTMFPVLVGANATGNQLPHIDGLGLTYNASTNALTATTFSGALSGNATTATTLATARAIYGNNFDGSAALTQIIASTYGGTGNGFTKFTGPTTAEKTFTLPDASSTIVVQGGALGTPSSGTVTNLTGTASININGTVGATTANTGAFTTLTFKDPREAIYDLGTTGGTIAPNVANGSVQKITLNAALTINAFTSPQAGQSLTLIIYGGTAYTSITSTMKFLGGVKTLTGTAGCIDILTVYYDGTTYFAALGKGYA